MAGGRVCKTSRKAQYTVSHKNTEPNPWLKRVVWVRLLRNKDPERLRVAIEPPDASKKPALQPTIESFS
jgi:hypothetical protein